MKARMKFEIAMAAGMSGKTLQRWFSSHKEELVRLGVSVRQQLLPPKVVDFVCHELGLDEEDFAARGESVSFS